MVANIPLIVAFLAGLVSFLSPCVLPIVPGFLAYLAGTNVKELGNQREIFINSLLFVFGFGLVFALLGVLLNGILARTAYDLQIWLSRLGGIIVIFFGLYLTGLFKLPFLMQERKLNVTRKFKSKYLTSIVFGAAFAVGWSPCVGPVLGGVLGLAVAQPGLAFLLLLFYSLGFGLPFLLLGTFTGLAIKLISRFQNKLKYLDFVFGLILIALGFLIFTQNLSLLTNF